MFGPRVIMVSQAKMERCSVWMAMNHCPMLTIVVYMTFKSHTHWTSICGNSREVQIKVDFWSIVHKEYQELSAAVIWIWLTSQLNYELHHAAIDRVTQFIYEIVLQERTEMEDHILNKSRTVQTTQEHWSISYLLSLPRPLFPMIRQLRGILSMASHIFSRGSPQQIFKSTMICRSTKTRGSINCNPKQKLEILPR